MFRRKEGNGGGVLSGVGAQVGNTTLPRDSINALGSTGGGIISVHRRAGLFDWLLKRPFVAIMLASPLAGFILHKQHKFIEPPKQDVAMVAKAVLIPVAKPVVIEMIVQEEKPQIPAPAAFPKAEEKKWIFPVAKDKKSPEYIAERIKHVIAEELMPKYSKYKDANLLLTWLIEQYGGEDTNKLQMHNFTREIGFSYLENGIGVVRTKKQSDLKGGDKARLEIALLAKSLSGGFPEEHMRDEMTLLVRKLFEGVPPEISVQLKGLYIQYSEEAAKAWPLGKFLEHQKKHEGKEAKPERPKDEPLVNPYVMQSLIEVVDRKRGSRNLESYFRNGLIIAA